MKKRIITGAAALLGTAMTIGSCGLYGPPQETNPAVYGPPEYFGIETSEATTTEISTSEDTFDPELTEVECVYGPPEWFETENTTTEAEITTAETTTTATTTMTSVTTTTTTTSATTSEETEDDLSVIGQFINDIFDPESNDPVDVYGPPEWFE